MSNVEGRLIGYDVVELAGVTRGRKKETYTVTFDRKAQVKHGYRHEPKADQGYVAAEELPPAVREAAVEVYAQRFNGTPNR